MGKAQKKRRSSYSQLSQLGKTNQKIRKNNCRYKSVLEVQWADNSLRPRWCNSSRWTQSFKLKQMTIRRYRNKKNPEQISKRWTEKFDNINKAPREMINKKERQWKLNLKQYRRKRKNHNLRRTTMVSSQTTLKIKSFWLWNKHPSLTFSGKKMSNLRIKSLIYRQIYSSISRYSLWLNKTQMIVTYNSLLRQS